MTHYNNTIKHRCTFGNALAVFACVFSVLAAGVNGYSMPLASDPTNVRSQWDIPFKFGRVSIPGARIMNGYYDDQRDGDTQPNFYSPLQPVDSVSSQDAFEEHGNSGYEAFWNPRARSQSLFSLAASAPSPLSTGRVWDANNLFGNGMNSFLKTGGRSGSFTRGSPALSMANYMQNGGPGNGSSRNNNYNNNNRYNDNRYNDNNRDYNSNDNYNNNNNNNNRDNYDDRDRNSGGRGSYDNNDRYGRGGQPRGTNRFNTVGSVGSVNGSNVSRGGRSMQFQNRRESNIAGRSGRMLDDSYNQFAPDPTTRFESRAPNDAYARGGYRQDSSTGHWTDPNSNYNINESPRPTSYSSDNRYSNNPHQSSSSSSFTSVPPGDYISTPNVRAPNGSNRGGYGASGNVPYDNFNYNSNNYESQDYYENDSDFYSPNGNIMDNRRGSRRDRRNSGGPGMDQNGYNMDYQDSNRRMDRGGGLARYRPNNERPGGGIYGNGYDYEVGGHDDYYDSSGSFYNHEGKRVRRYNSYNDSPEGYYNPDSLSNDNIDPDRMLQNRRRREGRDVKNGAYLRKYDREWDSRQGLYDEASLYGSDVKSTRSYASGYGDNMDNRVVNRGRRRRNAEDPSVLGGGWGETGGRNRYPTSSGLGDYQDGDNIEDGYDRGQSRSGRQQGDRYRRGDNGYDDYDYNSQGRSGGMRRDLGRRDVDNERDYYRPGDYRGGPNIRGDDSMERFRQGKDVKKGDLYGFETGNTPSSKKRIRRGKSGRGKRDMREGQTVNGSYNAPSSRGRRAGGGRINGSAGRDRGLSLDDLNEML